MAANSKMAANLRSRAPERLHCRLDETWYAVLTVLVFNSRHNADKYGYFGDVW